LIGEYEASGYKTPPQLARRGDGQALQLTPILYAALEAIDGQRPLHEVAVEIGRRIDRDVSEDNAYALAEKLVDAGLVIGPDGNEPEVQRTDALLALRLRFDVLSERVTNALTRPFIVLLHPLVMIPVIAAFVAAVVWLLGSRGVGAGAREMMYSPGVLLGVFAATALSAGFHEFGHAAALRYSGGRPGAMGAGLYLVWPAFYTDVTDAYRLSRGGRLRTDLGGLYFNALFVLGTVGLWRVTGVEALLVLVPLQLFQMTQQLMPFVRLDGYQILSDLCGVPDLFARIKPTVKQLLPGQEPEPAVTELKPWVRVVVTLWILFVVPMLAMSVLVTAISLPRILATAWDSTQLQWQGMHRSLAGGDWARAGVGLIGTAAVLLPIAGSVYMMTRFGRRMGRGAWGLASRVPAGRPILGALGVATAIGLAFLWWPNGEYRPLQPGERGRVTDAVRAVSDVPSGRPGLTERRAEELHGAPGRADTTTPTENEPAPTTTTVTRSDDDRLETPTTTRFRTTSTTPDVTNQVEEQP
jgi:putative peptide zinc metalloprotease protein